MSSEPMEVAQGQDWRDFGLWRSLVLTLKVVATAGGYYVGNNGVGSLSDGKIMEGDMSGGKNQTGICCGSSERSRQAKTFTVSWAGTLEPDC